MSDINGSNRAGRPAGPTLETQERLRRVQTMHSNGLSVNMIAECEGIKDAYVRKLLLLKDAPPDDSPKPEAAREVRPLSRRTLMDRAWFAVNSLPPFRLIDDGVQMLWLRAVMAIHDCGDGTELTFSRPGFFHDIGQFARALNRTPADITALFEQGLLQEVGNGRGVALPRHFNLRPREGRPRAPRMLSAPLPFLQREMLHVLPGGRSTTPPDAPETPSERAGNPADSRQQFPLSVPEIANRATDITSEQIPLYRSTTTTTTKELKDNDFSGGGGGFPTVPPTHESVPENPPKRAENPPETRLKPPPDPAVHLAGEVAALCGYAQVKPDDIDTVRAWLRFPGITDELIFDAVRADRAKANPRPIYKLSWFTGDIAGALTVAKAAADQANKPPPAAPGAPPPPSADDLMRARLDAQWKRWNEGHRPGPMPPLFPAFKKLMDGGPAEDAAWRWLSVFDAWWDKGRPHDACPPAFEAALRDPIGFEEDIRACESTMMRPPDDEP